MQFQKTDFFKFFRLFLYAITNSLTDFLSVLIVSFDDSKSLFKICFSPLKSLT